jgi:dTDP-4-amino-4,6-dideoxygalactose transaminase
MIFTYCRPVGELISLSKHSQELEYAGFNSNYFASGTMALTSALKNAIRESAQRTQSKHQPEVLIPAYACPDIVSACIGANVKPILVDLEDNTPFQNERMLRETLSEKTIAIVLVNFLGLSAPDSLLELARELNLLVIEDRAQSFITPNEASQLFGDYVIFSFGKGKPVSLLGGGALLKSIELKTTPIEKPIKINKNFLKIQILIRAYNSLIKPLCYFWLLRVPGLSIGETQYRMPETPVGLDRYRIELLPENITRQNKPKTKLFTAYFTLLRQLDGALTFPSATNITQPLLRFPALCKTKKDRDRLLAKLNNAGFGASAMYNKPLNEIENIPLKNDQSSGRGNKYPKAKNFADRLIALPFHGGMSDRDINSICRIIKAFFKED